MDHDSSPAPTDAAEDALASWRRRTEPFSAVCADVTAWEAPSPCEGWTARDVLEHVMDTQRDFLAQRGHDLPPVSGPDPAARWSAHRGAVEALLANPEVAGAAFEGAFGPTTIGAVLTEFYGFDLVVHRWDPARSQGREETLDAEERALIGSSVAAWGEHAYAPGIFATPPEIDPEASEQHRVLALTGRRA